MGFPRQKSWSVLPFLSPGDLPDPRFELMSPVAPTLTGRFFTTEPPGKPKGALRNTKFQRLVSRGGEEKRFTGLSGEHGEGEEERQEVKWSTGLIWEG